MPKTTRASGGTIDGVPANQAPDPLLLGERLIVRDGSIEFLNTSGVVDTTLSRDSAGTIALDGTVTVTGATVLNEAGADADTRIEGDTDENLLFVDASTDRVGIGTATPAADLHVVGDAHAEAATTGATAISTIVTGDTFDRVRILGSGDIAIGPGDAARDVTLSRGAANRLDLDDTDLRIATAGRGLQIAEGSNARMGTATLVGGTVTVANTSVTANTVIFISRATTGGTEGHLSTVIDPGVDFDINSSSGTDTSTVNWHLIEPA